MADLAPLIPFFACDQDRCPGWEDPDRLVATVRGETYCSSCWRRAGCPTPGPCTAHEAEIARQDAVKKMQERGGAHAHLVRKGLT